ncbi:hypothetical protein NIES4103_02220 [Nostoc sp. NIES-4103]|nr:hypothetical protein NIES4103_02220 [Nostoc sp. NIES-4103]
MNHVETISQAKTWLTEQIVYKAYKALTIGDSNFWKNYEITT